MLGLKRTSSAFEWVTGEPFDLSLFQSGQPNDSGETCGFIWSGNNGYWHDYGCHFKSWFICEFEIGK